VQADPLKPKLKPPGTNRLKLMCDIPVSHSAFKFNLRRYTVEAEFSTLTRQADIMSAQLDVASLRLDILTTDGGAVLVDCIKIRVESAHGFSA